MSDVAIELDNLARANALLEQQDEVQLRLEADIGLSEAIDLALDAAASRDAGIPSVQTTIDMARYIAKLAGTEDEDLRVVAAILREEYAGVSPSETTTEDVLTRLDRLAIKREIARLGVLDVDAFRANVSDEVTRHRRIQDPLALYVVRYDSALEAEEELRLVRALREIAVNPGETIGRVAPRSYGMLIPWIEPERAQALLEMLDALVHSALPHPHAALGLSAAVPEPGPGRRDFPWPTPAAPSRALNGRSRSR